MSKEEIEDKLDEVLSHVDPRAGLKSVSPQKGVERYLKNREGEIGDSSINAYEDDLENVVEFCEKRNITELKELDGDALDELETWVREEVPEEVEEYAPKTMRDFMYRVRNFIKYLEDIEAAPEGLHQKVDVPDLDDGEGVSDDYLEANRAQKTMDYLSKYEYASWDHMLWTLLAVFGDRLGTIRAIDVDDCHHDEDDPYIDLQNRPDQGTKLKSGDDSEREVNIPPWVADVIGDFIDTKREDVTDEYGREPLLPAEGRASRSAIRKHTYRLTEPCKIANECPHDRDMDECKAKSNLDHASKCPSSKSPHAVRKGYITAQRKNGVPKSVLSGRCDVSEAVLEKHYEFLNKEEERKIRKQILEEVWEKTGGYVD